MTPLRIYNVLFTSPRVSAELLGRIAIWILKYYSIVLRYASLIGDLDTGVTLNSIGSGSDWNLVLSMPDQSRYLILYKAVTAREIHISESPLPFFRCAMGFSSCAEMKLPNMYIVNELSASSGH